MRSKYIPPHVQQDGTFCVVTKFVTTQDAASLQHQVTDWCKQWLIEHEDWQRPVDEESADIDKDPWDYSDIFFGTPYVIKAEGNKLWLRLDARVYSYWWRDWYAGMMGNLVRAFPELRREKRLTFSCDDTTD